MNISETAKNYGLAGVLVGSVPMLILAFCAKAGVIPKHVGILLFILVPLVIMVLIGITYAVHKKSGKMERNLK